MSATCRGRPAALSVHRTSAARPLYIRTLPVRDPLISERIAGRSPLYLCREAEGPRQLVSRLRSTDRSPARPRYRFSSTRYFPLRALGRYFIRRDEKPKKAAPVRRYLRSETKTVTSSTDPLRVGDSGRRTVGVRSCYPYLATRLVRLIYY